VIALAVPLFLPDGTVIASLTVSGPTYRMTEEKIRRNLALLQQAKVEIMDIIHKYKIDFSRYLNVYKSFVNVCVLQRLGNRRVFYA
jgi:hypothetical protein